LSGPILDKEAADSLALFGGRPAFAEPLHVGRPNIGSRARLLERIEQMLDSRWLSNQGPFVRELEERLASFLGVRHAIATANGAVGLEIAARALDLEGEVIVPSFTFIATAHALEWQQIRPVFADIDPATHAIHRHSVEPLITPRTTGIVGVHLWGEPCVPEELTALARERGLKLLFDAAHAFGCSHHGAMIGGFGDAEVFSFHATKYFNTFEGGAIATNDDRLAARVRLMKNFGFAGYDNVECVGINGKMSEVSAAMGLTGLESLEEFRAANRRNYAHYRDRLASLPGIRLFEHRDCGLRNYQHVVLEVDDAAGIDRDLLVRILRAENVLARRYFHPGCHRMEPYRAIYPDAGRSLPETERLCRRVLVLPTGESVGPEDIEGICAILRTAIEFAPEVVRRAQGLNG
jgi:dTDP-4-amino-4,6-dideoxygalactose transaminase